MDPRGCVGVLVENRAHAAGGMRWRVCGRSCEAGVGYTGPQSHAGTPDEQGIGSLATTMTPIFTQACNLAGQRGSVASLLWSSWTEKLTS